MRSPLTINVGVSGHRDIPAHNIHRLEKAVSQELHALKQRYPHSTINLLSGLAAGADQLVAKVALKLRLDVIAILPFELAEYENDFDSAASLQQFRDLLRQCYAVKICPSNQGEPREQGYTTLAKTLVKFSDIVIVVWDGILEQEDEVGGKTTLPGGTADVVKMCIEGVIDDNSLLFAKPNKTYCKWLMTSREKNQDTPTSFQPDPEIASWKAILLDGTQDQALLNEILAKTERFNVNALLVKKKDRVSSAESLLGSNPPVSSLAPLNMLINAFCVADWLAQKRQKQRLKSIKAITSMSFIAIFAQQVYVSLYPSWVWFLIHVFLVITAIGIYRIFFTGTDSKEEQFVEWRVFAEDLRVQIFWHLAGITEHSVDNYRTTKLHEMDWIVDSLNKLMFNIVPPSSSNIAYIRQQWIIDQRNYFIGQRGERGRAAQLSLKATHYQRTAIGFFCTAFILMFFSAFKVHADFWPALSTPVVFVVIAMLFISSALVKTFAAQMGFEELSQRYLRTGYYFQQAVNKMAILDKNNQGEVRAYQKIIRTMGIEALNENAAWLQLHKMNAYQVQVN